MTTFPKSSAARCLALGTIAVWLGAALPPPAMAKDPVRLKEAKLIIEHNATDLDTGFQAFVDGEGWEHLELAGPGGPILRIDGKGTLGELGLTELFFETVEPENSDLPVAELLEDFPAGEYTFRGRGMIDGERTGEVLGVARLSHDIPAGPRLVSPAAGATVPHRGLVARWDAVTHSIRGAPVRIIGYQLIVERDVEPAANMIGKWGLSMHLPPTTTSMPIPADFLQPATAYKWEVLAIEESGNQTLSSGGFRTE